MDSPPFGWEWSVSAEAAAYSQITSAPLHS